MRRKPVSPRYRRRAGLLAALIGVAAVAQPTAAPPPARERAIQGPLADEVTRVATRVAAAAGGGPPLSVTLVDSPVANAYAGEDGAIAISRQLVALMQNESELAFVLGHEIAHVRARHLSKRKNYGGLSSALASAWGAVTGSDLVSQAVRMDVQQGRVAFGRDQELEADRLSVGYMRKAGFDPRQAAGIFRGMEADWRYQERAVGRSGMLIQSWLSSHPGDAERTAQLERLAGGAAATVHDPAFLKLLDGVTFGYDGAAGMLVGNEFRHAGLGLRFTVPVGYRIDAGAKGLNLSGPAGTAQLRGVQGTAELDDVLAAAAKSLPPAAAALQTVRTSPARVNGLSAGYRTAPLGDGSGTTLTLFGYAFPDQRFFVFLLMLPRGTRDGPLSALPWSMTPLSAAEADAIRSRKIITYVVRPGDDDAKLAGRMAYPDERLERLFALNELTAGAAVPGMTIKLVSDR